MKRNSNHIGLLFILFIVCIVNNNLRAQTCCTGSAPITGSIRISSIPNRQWDFSLIVDHNYISDLFAYDTKLNNDNLIRTTNTFLLQTNYGLSDRLSAALIIPYIYKSDQSNTNSTPFKVSTSALGDLSIILQYAIVKRKSFSILLGSGLKFATGSTQTKDSDSQIILEPSLQPGSGSYDYLFLSQFQFYMPFRPSLSVTQSFTYQLTGISNNFVNNSSYKFGNEFQFFTTISDQFVLLNKIIAPSVTLRVSTRESNIIDQYEDINSGGTMIYLDPSAILQLNPTFSLLMQVDIPVYRKINGFQLIPTYIIRGGLLIKIRQKEIGVLNVF